MKLTNIYWNFFFFFLQRLKGWIQIRQINPDPNDCNPEYFSSHLPQSQGSVLGAGGIKLTIRAEPHTVDRPKMPLEVIFTKNKTNLDKIM